MHCLVCVCVVGKGTTRYYKTLSQNCIRTLFFTGISTQNNNIYQYICYILIKFNPYIFLYNASHFLEKYTSKKKGQKK